MRKNPSPHYTPALRQVRHLKYPDEIIMIYLVKTQNEKDLSIKSILPFTLILTPSFGKLPISFCYGYNRGVLKVISARVHHLLDNFDKYIGNTIKEQLSFAYVRAISSICAFKCDRPDIDNGIDFYITPLMPLDGLFFKEPIIKVQVKHKRRPFTLLFKS